MAAVTFDSMSALKKQAVASGVKGFPVPMAKQIAQGGKRRHKVRFPDTKKPSGKGK